MARHLRRRPPSERLLIGLEAATGALAVAGGGLLIVRPDGSLLGADQSSVLDGSPFRSWLVPGILLLTLVGCGFLVAALVLWRWASQPAASVLSILAGIGLVAFEAFEVVWLGVQVLELVFMGVGLAVAALGLQLRRSATSRPTLTSQPMP